MNIPDGEFDEMQAVLVSVLKVLPPAAKARAVSFALMNATAMILAQMSDDAQLRAPGTLAGLIETEKKRLK